MLRPLQIKILEALAEYKFLTYGQMSTLKLSQSASYIRTKANDLAERGYIKKFDYGVHAILGRYPLVFTLLTKGKNILLELGWQEQSIRMLKGRSASNKYINDYFHRRGIVDCHIALMQQTQKANIQIEFFHTYFDKTGNVRKDNSLKALTAIPTKQSFFVADAVFIAQKQGDRFLYCLELHNGKNSKKLLKQLDAYIEAMLLGSASIKYKINKSPRVICLFEDKGCMQAVQQRFYAQEQYQAFFEGFIFDLFEYKFNFLIDSKFCKK